MINAKQCFGLDFVSITPCAEPHAGWCGAGGLRPPATRLYAHTPHHHEAFDTGADAGKLFRKSENIFFEI